MAVIVGDARPAAVRADVRTALARARLAEWREGVWIRPANLGTDEDPRCAWLDVRPDDDAVALAEQLFAPVEWSNVAMSLVARLETATRELRIDPPAAIAPAFLAGAAALRHIRADAQLPNDLVPQPWPGPTGVGVFIPVDAQVQAQGIPFDLGLEFDYDDDDDLFEDDADEKKPFDL